MDIQRKYNKAVIFTDNADEESIRQIYSLLNNPGFADTRIAIMPDVHMGKGSVVGFTMKFNGYTNPGSVWILAAELMHTVLARLILIMRRLTCYPT